MTPRDAKLSSSAVTRTASQVADKFDLIPDGSKQGGDASKTNILAQANMSSSDSNSSTLSPLRQDHDKFTKSLNLSSESKTGLTTALAAEAVKTGGKSWTHSFGQENQQQLQDASQDVLSSNQEFKEANQVASDIGSNVSFKGRELAGAFTRSPESMSQLNSAFQQHATPLMRQRANALQQQHRSSGLGEPQAKALAQAQSLLNTSNYTEGNANDGMHAALAAIGTATGHHITAPGDARQNQGIGGPEFGGTQQAVGAGMRPTDTSEVDNKVTENGPAGEAPTTPEPVAAEPVVTTDHSNNKQLHLAGDAAKNAQYGNERVDSVLQGMENTPMVTPSKGHTAATIADNIMNGGWNPGNILMGGAKGALEGGSQVVDKAGNMTPEQLKAQMGEWREQYGEASTSLNPLTNEGQANIYGYVAAAGHNGWDKGSAIAAAAVSWVSGGGAESDATPNGLGQLSAAEQSQFWQYAAQHSANAGKEGALAVLTNHGDKMVAAVTGLAQEKGLTPGQAGVVGASVAGGEERMNNALETYKQELAINDEDSFVDNNGNVQLSDNAQREYDAVAPRLQAMAGAGEHASAYLSDVGRLNAVRQDLYSE